MNLVRNAGLNVLALIVSGVPAHAQNTVNFLSGSKAPQTLTLKDLNASWRVFTLAPSGGAVDKTPTFQVTPNNDLFTKGDTVSIGDQSFLVAYEPAPPQVDVTALAGGDGPNLSPLGPDTVLDQSFINVRDIVGLEDMRPFDMKSEIASSVQETDTINALYAAPNLYYQGSPTDVDLGGYLDDRYSDAYVSMDRLKTLSLVMSLYVQDHNDKLPAGMGNPTALRNTLYPYASSENIFLQPGINELYAANAALSSRTINYITDPDNTVLFYEITPDQSGQRLVAFADGHVKLVDSETWISLEKNSNMD